MKKYIYSIFAAATLMGFAACDDGDYTDWKEPQKNAQEEVIASASEAIVQGITGVDELYDFEAQNYPTVKIFNPANTDYSTKYQVKFSNGAVYGVVNKSEIIGEELQAAIIDIYGKRPEVRTLDATIIATTEVAGVSIKNEKTVQVKAKLKAPIIYEHLYLIGAPSEWSATCTTMPFKHSGKDVYEDPVFTCTFPVSNGDTWFAMADDKTVETNDWGNVFAAVEGNGMNLVGEEGKIARRCELPSLNPDAGDGSFKVSVNDDAKFVKVTVNLLEGTYYIEKISFRPYIYFIGATDGWKESVQRLAHQADGLYTGFCYVADPNNWGLSFKFQQEAGSWNDQINASQFSEFSGVWGDDNFTVGSEGVYYIALDVQKGTISCTLMEYMGVTGGFTGWNEGVQMTWNATEFCYEAAAAVTDAGWKFRANGPTDPNWGVNLGGTLGNLYQNGDNLDAAGSTVKLYPCRTTNDNIYCTVE